MYIKTSFLISVLWLAIQSVMAGTLVTQFEIQRRLEKTRQHGELFVSGTGRVWGKTGDVLFLDDHFRGEDGSCHRYIPIQPLLNSAHSGLDKIFQDAIPLRQSYDKGANQCQNGKVIRYLDQHYIGCFNKDGGIYKILMEDYEISIKSKVVEKDLEIPGTMLSALKCPATPNPIGLAQPPTPWFHRRTTCMMHWLRDEETCGPMRSANGESNKIDSKAGGLAEMATEDCLFLHGAGNDEEGEPLTDWPGYWGKVVDYTPQCKTRLFLRTNTKLRGWDNKELQDIYCKFAANGTTVTRGGETIPSIQKKTIFVHSMGNLILASSFRDGICDYDPETSKWYNIQGPMKGSKAAVFVNHICEKVAEGYKDKLYHYVAEKGGYCVPGQPRAYHAYLTLQPGYPGMEGLAEYVQPMVYRSMCGDSSWGITGTSSVLWALAKIVDYGEENDGMVPMLSSCQVVPPDEYSKDFNTRYYATDANHSNGRCHDGNGLRASSKPCSFYLPLEQKR